jgi:hypothetical protein
MRVAFLEPSNYYELNPPDENRTYSTSNGSSWELSMLDSSTGWHENYTEADQVTEWMTLDAG